MTRRFATGVLALLEETPPPGMSHWDGPAVAERLDASVRIAVWRVLRREANLSATATQMVA